jgi:general secretion pathway protein C
MLTLTPATWTVRGATVALWALAAASTVFWGLKLGGDSSGVLAPLPPARAVVPPDPGAIARLLGGAPALAMAAAEPTLASRFQLVGVVAGERSGAGAAVISVDGRPARPYRVGSSLDQGLVLQSVRGRTAAIASSMSAQPLLTLELPQPRSELPGQPAAIAAPR